LNAKRTVEELETAGVAALSIEDTELPTPFGSAKPRLISIAEGVGKMKAAVAGRQDPLLCIAGRTGAAQITNLEDAVARGKAYEAVGVDALFMVGLRTRAELDAISAATGLPLILGGATPELSDRDYLAARRVRVALQGHAPFAAAVKAVHDTLKALREGTPPSKLAGIADAELMKRVTRDGDYATWAKEFLGG
jgi:carboxyvinyl-carboxyphosphonate phosphorylmutase